MKSVFPRRRRAPIAVALLECSVLTAGVLWPFLPRPVAAGIMQGAGGGRIGPQDTFESENLLTPGETDDWPLQARDGETVILSVTSDAFDPTVALVGPAGEVLAKNDDIRTGEQDALLLFRLPAAGAYKVRVTASKSVAGGRYRLAVRRFVATGAAVGARTAGTLGANHAAWHRFPAEAGQTLVVTARAAAFPPTLEVYAPNGEEVEPDSADGADAPGGASAATARAIFRAGTAGDYYVRLFPRRGGDPRDSYALTVAAARVFSTTTGAPQPPHSLTAGGLDLWTFPGKPGDVIRLRSTATGADMALRLAFLPPPSATPKAEDNTSVGPPLVLLPTDPKAGGERIALLNREGNYQAAVFQPLSLNVEAYTFAMDPPVRTLLGGTAPAAGSLALGASDYWSLEGKVGDILRLEGLSTAFDVSLDLFGPDGGLIGSNDDGGTVRNALLTALVRQPGRYLVRVHALGDGGSGAYRLRRAGDPVRALPADGRTQGTLGAGGSEIWSFSGQAGQTIILSARSSDFDTRISVIGPDSAEIASDDDGGDGTDSLLSVRLPLTGTYTVWVSAKSGAGRYVLHRIEE